MGKKGEPQREDKRMNYFDPARAFKQLKHFKGEKIQEEGNEKFQKNTQD